jgi:hypothetical protein
MSKWIKVLDLSKELSIDAFSLFKNFRHVADVILTPETVSAKTCILFEPAIEVLDWKDQTSQWIYVFTINEKIVKIGGTRSGLKGRAASYLCGHHTTDRGKSGKCSVTNAYLYNTFEDSLKQGNIIKMYGFKIPDVKVEMSVWEKNITFSPQTYTVFETTALEQYKLECGKYPQLSDNSDPSHR